MKFFSDFCGGARTFRFAPIFSFVFLNILSFFATFFALFANPTELFAATEVVSLDGSWRIQTDPENVGRDERRFDRPLSESAPTSEISVPGVLQQVFREFHGVVWYEREFATPRNTNAKGRALLRFWQAEYRADVWLNGQYLGFHEGGEAAFELDATAALAPIGAENRLTVRVLNAADAPIDGISIANVPSRNNTNVVSPGNGYASGGLVDSVEILLVPETRIADLHLIPNWKTGEITVRATMRSAASQHVSGEISLVAASVDGGEFAPETTIAATIAPGETLVEGKIHVPNFKLWNLNDPNLYSVVAEWRASGENAKNTQDEQETSKTSTVAATDRRTATCGFRDFRFENGAFRLNGKRIYLKCSHSGSDSPITHRLPLDPDLYRKDIITCKTAGFNAIRYIAGTPRRFQLDLCDRIGFLVYDECLAAWRFDACPERAERFVAQTEGMILRDRNHPSVVIWGLLNETNEATLVLQAANFLPRVRELDPDRVVILNSGSFDPFAGQETKLADYAIWRRQAAPIMPAAIKNETNAAIVFDGTNWEAGTFFLHPGDSGGEYAVLRWTAPEDGEYKIDAKFRDVVRDGVATVDLHLFAAEKEIWRGFLNVDGAGKEAFFNGNVALRRNDVLSVVVGIGDGAGFGDTTATEFIVTAPDGTVYNANDDYSYKNNPNGVWTLGFLPAGATPNLAAFQPFDLGQKALEFAPIGRYANPQSVDWRNDLADTHPYKPVPHVASVIDELRTHSSGSRPVFLSEYGIGSAVDLFRLTRFYEQFDATDAADARHYRDRLDRFNADWNRWRLDETFESPEDFFRQAIAQMAEQRRIGIGAIRANANVVAHSVTGTHDQGISGEGLTTLFRELKPGTVDALADVFAPLRFSCFVEPNWVRSGNSATVEAVLINEDALAPGDYPIRIRIIGPKNERVFDETRTLTVPTPPEGGENPFAIPAFSEKIPIVGSTGEYRLIVSAQENAAARGEERFFVANDAERPKIEGRFVVWGGDDALLKRLRALGADAVPFERPDGSREELTPDSKIVVGRTDAFDKTTEFPKLYESVRAGADVLFIAAQDAFSNGNDRVAFLPFEEKGRFETLPNWLYHKDDWGAFDETFAGLQAGGVLDYVFWRDLIPQFTFNGQPKPDRALAGAFNTQMGYSSGLSIAVWRLGASSITLSTFKIEENPDNPLAERLLTNLLNQTARQ